MLTMSARTSSYHHLLSLGHKLSHVILVSQVNWSLVVRGALCEIFLFFAVGHPPQQVPSTLTETPPCAEMEQVLFTPIFAWNGQSSESTFHSNDCKMNYVYLLEVI